MTKSRLSFIKHLDFLILDLLTVQISFMLASFIYAELFDSRIIFGQLYSSIAWLMAISVLFLAVASFPYKNILKRDKFDEIKAVLQFGVKCAVFDIVSMYMLRLAGASSRITVFMTWGLFFLLSYAIRVIWKRVLRRRILNDRPDACTHIIVLAKKSYIKRAIKNINSNIFAHRKIKGVFLTDYDCKKDSGMMVSGYPVLGKEKELIEYATHNWVDEVVICLPYDNEVAEKVAKEVLSMGITVDRVLMRIHIGNDDYTPMIKKYGNYIVAVTKNRSVPLGQWFFKRLLDIVGSIIGLIFTVIVFIFIAPQIYYADPGPIFFSQDRVGKNGKIFKMYKFRSMYQDAEERKVELMKQNEMNGFMFKMKDDPRIIGSEKKDKNGKSKGIGNFIRKTSLDEFPQFFNVLKGDMSLVGTRPPTVDEWKHYSETHRKRLAMRPGITGMWQVSGRSDITDFDEVVRLDSQYIDTWNIFMDIKILFMTIGQVVSHKGAE